MNTVMPQDIIPFSNVSVKVMRSHDYCHFEVQLGHSGPITAEAVDGMRKAAARLADKAVEQYKIAKENADDRRNADYTAGNARIKAEADRIREMAETDRSDSEKATLKDYEDAVFRAGRSYDYQDDWGQDDDATE